MILIHLESNGKETLVRLPDGSTQWVNVADMMALAESDKPRSRVAAVDPGHGAPDMAEAPKAAKKK